LLPDAAVRSLAVQRVEFDWDEAKRASNLEKHGIDFVRARTVFDDPDHFTELATATAYGEVRWKAIGRVGVLTICVIFTDRGAKRRIISARRARRDEREQYRAGAQPA
jgi:uncharacterized DUF497 family protein